LRPRGRATLVCGTPGCGKTMLGGETSGAGETHHRRSFGSGKKVFLSLELTSA
jgi:hypothetical protein